MSRHADSLLRLRSLGERNALDAERRAAIASRLSALADREAWKGRVAVADGLFPTPPDLARRMAAMLDLAPGARVLEPSAGTGRLLDALIDAHPEAQATAAEQCPRLCRHLFEKYPGTRLWAGDFLTMDYEDRFAAVLMNPPFRRGSDVRHILHARRYLEPGGKLVALCYDGSAQRRHLQPIADTWEPIPGGAFHESGTDAACVLLTLSNKGIYHAPLSNPRPYHHGDHRHLDARLL